jgi:hypothetical protein
MENLSEDILLLGISYCVNLAALLGAVSTGLVSISPQLPMGNFSQPLVGTSVFKVAKLRGSLHWLPWTLALSKYSDVVGEESPCELACYQHTKVC